jgi:DNA (cytosine-5)-methyltransferase 1
MPKPTKSIIKAPTVIDLFCGAGGMSLGFQNAGCEILGGIENNPHALKTHHKNFPNSKLSKLNFGAQDIGDIDLLELPIKPGDVDILIGGPPCQVFSVVGMGKIKSLGKQIQSDARNFLYKYFIDFLSYYKPIFFVIENVNTLKSNPIFPTLTGELEEGLPAHQHDYPGYEVKYQILLASDYGVPQLRKRLFIVGRRKDTNLSFEFPKKNTSTPVSVGEAYIYAIETKNKWSQAEGL